MDLSSFSIGNAAGFIKGPGKLFDDMLRSAATHIVIGSITRHRGEGNPGTTYERYPDGTSINALGLPNPGLDEILTHAQEMGRRAGALGKRISWSIAGQIPPHYAALAHALSPFGDVEVNLGCPNVWGDGEQKPIAGFKIQTMEAILRYVMDSVVRGTTITLKVSPYSDPNFLKEVAEVIKRYNPHAIVTSNTFPNGVGTIDTPHGYGGVGGNALHHIALGQVSQFVDALASTGIKVTGVGGIDSGYRLAAMHKAGACGVQIGTAYGESDAGIFTRVLEEAVNLTN
ncbi:MAG: dihydroorotate dehydrogenase [Patescibacteria group bacterium]